MTVALSPAAVLRSLVAACLAAERLPLAWAVEHTRDDGVDPVALAWATCADPEPMLTLARWVNGCDVAVAPEHCPGTVTSVWANGESSELRPAPVHHWREQRRMGPCLDCALAARWSVDVLTLDMLALVAPAIAAEAAAIAAQKLAREQWDAMIAGLVVTTDPTHTAQV